MTFGVYNIIGFKRRSRSTRSAPENLEYYRTNFSPSARIVKACKVLERLGVSEVLEWFGVCGVLEWFGVCEVLEWLGVCEVLEWFGVCESLWARIRKVSKGLQPHG